MFNLLKYTLNKDLFITLIRFILSIIAIFFIFVFINSNFSVLIFISWLNLPSLIIDLVFNLISNLVLFLVIYSIVLLSYYFFEKLFLLRDIYNSISKILVVFLVLGIGFNLLIESYILKTLLDLSNLLLLFQTFQKLHKRQIQKLLEYPSLSKAIHIKLLEIKANKENRLDERKRSKEQLEQKYLDDLNKLNSNR